MRDVSLEHCALLARQAGEEIWRRYGVPVYFYEAAAARPDRARLEDVRQGQFEGLRDAVRRDPRAASGCGRPGPAPHRGRNRGRRPALPDCWNVFLDKPDVALARSLAREVRDSGGGLKGVKALGALVRGRAQISMNLTRLRVN